MKRSRFIAALFAFLLAALAGPAAVAQGARGALSAAEAEFQRNFLAALDEELARLEGEVYVRKALAGLDRLEAGLARIQAAEASGGDGRAAAPATAPTPPPVTGELPAATDDQRMRTLLAAGRGERIIGGERDLPDGRYKEALSLFSERIADKCSGVFVRPGRMLTAAHCVCTMIPDPNAPDQVYVGANTTIQDSVQHVVLAATLFPGTGCSGSSATLGTPDLALVTFDTSRPDPNMLNAALAPNFAGSLTRLPAELGLAGVRADTIEVVGFGADSTDGTMGVGTRRVVRLDTTRACRLAPGGFPGNTVSESCFSGTEFVASSSRSVDGVHGDSCSGDSGGPLLTLDANNDRFLVAVVARGPRFCGAAGGFSGEGIYTNVTTGAVCDWLKAQLVEGICPQ